MSKRKLAILVSIIFFSSIFAPLQNSFGQTPNDNSGPQLAPPQVVKAFVKNRYHIKSIDLNPLGLYRVNLERARKKLPLIDQTKALPMGQEIEAVKDSTTAVPQAVSTVQPRTGTTYLPSSVDNSVDPSFPPLGDQNPTNSCQSWAIGYYQLSYMNATSIANLNGKGWTISNGDPTKIFSPSYLYSIVNMDGIGAYMENVFPILETNGITTLANFPWTTDYKPWDMNPDHWQQALSYRINPALASPYGTDAGSVSNMITHIKQLLNNGYLVTFGTWRHSWVFSTITQANDSSLVGKSIALWQDNSDAGHVMTFVGYDDSIGVNVGNGTIEMGAFKVANSYGPVGLAGDVNGFDWVSYDALYTTSQSGYAAIDPPAVYNASGFLQSGRTGIIYQNVVYNYSVKPNYTPKVIAKFTVNTLRRNQLNIFLGTSSTSRNTPSTTFGLNTGAFNYNGNNLAFNGLGTAVDGTFVLDFTDILPAVNTNEKYYLGITNSSECFGSPRIYPACSTYSNQSTCTAISGCTWESTNPTTLKSYQLIDLTTGTTVSATGLPITVPLDGTAYSSINYTYTGHTPPTANIVLNPPTQPISGTTSLPVTFDGSASSAASGSSITTYSWDFGDGTSGLGITPSHTYTNLTQNRMLYNVVLTVTDNQGGTGSYTFPTAVTLGPLPNPPVASATALPTSGRAPLTVNFDASSSTDAGGTITDYTWTFGDGTLPLDMGGVTTVSHQYTIPSYSAMPKVTITDSRGAKSSFTLASIKTNTLSNPPIASATSSPASPISGTAPLTVNFDASGSSTSSGNTITSYLWNFGDGSPIQNLSTSTTSYTYTTAGTFTAKLQVEDTRGITSNWQSISTATVAANPIQTPTAPDAPSIGTATAGNAQATVAFSAPANNGGNTITGYTATSSPGGLTGTGTSSPITVSGLTNGTAYSFTVTATNSVGTSAASAASNSITPQAAATAPGAPTIGTATAGNALATVAFSAPASNGGSAITGYTVTSSPGGKTGTGTSSPITVSGLTNATAYTFTVTATNAVGISSASAASNSVTPQAAATAPGAPTIGTATAGNAQATVAFSAPASNGGSAITGYTVTSSPGGKTGTGTSSPITVSGLTNATAYTFTVTATNAVGISSASAASNSVTPSTGTTTGCAAKNITAGICQYSFPTVTKNESYTVLAGGVAYNCSEFQGTSTCTNGTWGPVTVVPWCTASGGNLCYGDCCYSGYTKCSTALQRCVKS